MYKVVIVEDSDWTRRGLVATIPWEAHGFVVTGEAADGQQGLAMILEQKPDLVLLDIKMPAMDGLQMLQELRRRHHEGTEFIIISAYNDFTFARQAIVLGARDYLLKPIDQEETIRTLDRLMASLESSRQPDVMQSLLDSGRLDPEFAAFLRALELLQRDRSSVVGYAIGRMLDRFQTNLASYDVATELGISESTLSRQFKKGSGYTFGEFLSLVRIKKAIEFLLRPGSRVKEVAGLVGFGDTRYFSALFRKYVGCAPTELRGLHGA
jgi:two-component system response regulator YesN